MSVLLYRRPDYYHQPIGPINASDCARYVERAKNSERAIPSGLTFEDVVNNKSLPPCSLNDFMDYLVYVEHNAENLQFFLWYKDYVQRFNRLSENEKRLSPAWSPETAEVPNLAKDSEKCTKGKAKNEVIAAMMESGYDLKESTIFGDDSSSPTRSGLMLTTKENGIIVAPSITSSQGTAPSTAEGAAQTGLKWQPFTIQPMRDEINRVMRHYIAFSAPRELNLSHKDRALCLHALQHTTNPSALLPAITIAEAALRGQSHPNFIRWSICNGNKPRVFFVRTIGVSNISLGFLLAFLLTLSSASRWWRVFAAIEWFIGIATLVAAYKGLCIILHHSHTRNLRPWEQFLDSELGDAATARGGAGHDDEWNSVASIVAARNNMRMSSSRAGHSSRNESVDMDKFGGGGDDGTSSIFRPVSLQTFGPKNSFDEQSWCEKYERKPLIKKVFEKSVWTQDETLRVLQDRIVLGANLWAAIITIPLTIIFVAFPKGNFY